jgi:isopenicillin N synthase-like dioxygenase
MTADSVLPPVSFRAFDADFEAFAQGLGASFERYGFAVVTDHGLPQARIAAALEAARRFFALPEDVKRRYVTGVGGQRGYTAFGRETAKGAAVHDLKEFWHVGREPPPPGGLASPNVWPDEIPGFRAELGWLYGALDVLGGKLLQAIAVPLGLPRGWFGDKVDHGDSILRLLYYPPADFDGPHIRAAAHEDINVITLLLGAEEAGLELKDRDGRWLPAAPPPGALVCNIGDMLRRLTNNRLPSTSHRVVNPPPERRGVARYSTPFFLHFNPDFEIRTLPSCVDAQHPDLYPEPITAAGFLMERLREIKLV